MKRIMFFSYLVTILLLPLSAFSMLTTTENQVNNEKIYMYFSKTFFHGYDCSKTSRVLLLFEFNSEGDDENSFDTFVDSYVSGMELNDWRPAYFFDYKKASFKKYKCNDENFQEILIPPDFVYFESIRQVKDSECFFSKLLYPPLGANVDVEVHNTGYNNSKIISYLDFYEPSRTFNQVNKYRGTDEEYAKMVSEKIDDKIHKSLKLKTKQQCN